jgi:hypothetical protein
METSIQSSTDVATKEEDDDFGGIKLNSIAVCHCDRDLPTPCLASLF